ncbi:MAG TPA: Stk1 family PASTA domain-containing Ser/Thr kinase [Actinomycetota bacterium]|nr:Stk1 family PASTA domain-containing Ser/Thr kinase [Actinomycetota bacterium]
MVTPQPGSPLPGKHYGGRYEVKGSIASGGMAEVFVARDSMLDRLVALKLMHPEFARNEAFIERFRREAQAAASLNDPRIVAIYDWGSDAGTYFIVMEYVEGNTLAEIIKASGPLPISKATKIAIDVLGGLHLAHLKGIVHRDVKPANIAITVGGQIKVMDFGIARAAHDGAMTVTQTGMVIGTASYFSPEQAQGKPVDARSDIYSVGIVLYEMLTGVVPFKGESPVAVAYKHVTEDPAPPRSLAEDIPPALEAVVMKAISKNPDNRYQTALEMCRDLERVLRGEQVEATPLMSSSERTAMMGAAPYADPGPYAQPRPSYETGPERTSVLPPAGPPPRRAPAARGVAKGLVTVAVLVAIGIAVMAYFMLSETQVPDVTVPKVTGLPLEEAERLLNDEGLESRVARRQPSADVPALAVISQDPEDGRKVAEGAVVALVISQGPEVVDVPSLTGLSRQEAEARLAEAGLVAGEVTSEASDTVPEGQLISQSPASGKIEKGEPVNFVVSTGKKLVEVPAVGGLTQDEAAARIGEQGLTAKVATACDGSKADKTVLVQDPAPGEQVPDKSEVTITVNSQIKVPGVVGQQAAAAANQLEAAGFKAEIQSGGLVIPVFDRVTAQAPQPDEMACSGDIVRIRVS